MIDGNTILLAHLGYPTVSFKAPMIYNPWFEHVGCNAVVVPMAVRSEDFETVFAALRRLQNIRGALVTMPHKTAVNAVVDEVSTAGRVAGACNAVLFREDGSTMGDMFDGEGFVRGMRRKGRTISGATALVVGAGGVGSAIAASLAQAGAKALRLYDPYTSALDRLAGRLHDNFPALQVAPGQRDPDGCDVVVNASPLGMNPADPLPVEVDRIDPSAFVGEVVLKQEITPFLAAARARGCEFQVGTDMLFEQIPAYLEFFSLPVATPEKLRELAKVVY